MPAAPPPLDDTVAPEEGQDNPRSEIFLSATCSSPLGQPLTPEVLVVHIMGHLEINYVVGMTA